ncbi:MAG: glycosyltransferase [Bdellovibrionales bacterium]
MQATAKLVSVVIPAYNHERFVAQGLNGILNEQYPNKEIIVIDDGSRDGTLKVIEQWAEAHKQEIPVTIRSRQNKGISATLNDGISLARGDYILPIASDDYLLPGGICERVTYLENHPELQAVIGDCQMVDDEGKLLYQSCLRDYRHADPRDYATPERVAASIAKRWILPGPGLMARRGLYAKIGGYDEERKVEDWDFYLRMAARKTLGFIDYPVAAYRFHASNTCRSVFSQRLVLNELSRSGFRRARLFTGRLRLIVIAKAIFYGIKAFTLWLRSPAA